MKRLFFILFTIFLDSLGVGLLVPLLPDLLRKFTVGASELSLYYGIFLGSYASIQFFASPFLGALSDRFGRRPVLLLSLFGAGLDYILMAFAPNFFVLFLGRILSGVTGASMTVASSYMVDISPTEERAKNFGLIGAAFGLGFIAGPMLGGLFYQYGLSFALFFAAGLNLLNALFGYFILPESLAIDKRREINIKAINPFLSLGRLFRSPGLKEKSLVFFVAQSANQVHAANWAIFTQYRFAWTAVEVGSSLSLFGVCYALAQTFLPKPFTRFFGNKGSFLFGTFISALSFFAIGFASEAWMVYLVIAFSALSAVALPSLQAMISDEGTSDEQGELQGSLVSLTSLAAVIAPLIFAGLFAHFTSTNSSLIIPGAAYFSAGIMSFLALILFIGLSLKREAAIDPIGKYFTCYRETMNASTEAALYTYKIDGQIETLRASHEDYDGHGALLYVARSFDKHPVKLPVHRSEQRPTPIKQFLLFLKYMKFMNAPFSSNLARIIAPEGKVRTEAIHIMTAAETRILVSHAKKLGIGPTSLLLCKLHAAIASLSPDKTFHGRWSIPVNLRGPYEHFRDEANHSVALFLDLSHDLDETKVHRDIQAQLDSGVHWGSFFLVRTLALLPKPIYRALIRSDEERMKLQGKWFAVLSNLGQVEGLPDVRARAFLPATDPTAPLKATVLTWNGVMSLALSLDPWLSHYDIDAERLLKAWQSQLSPILSSSTSKLT